MTAERHADGNVTVRHDDVDTLCEIARHGTQTSKSGQDPDWYGTATFDAAIDLYRDGWVPGMASLNNALDAIDLPTIDLRRVRLTYDVAGGSTDIGRYLVGDPECMRRVVLSPVKPVIRVAVACHYSARWEVPEILANGAPVVALCDLLGAAGFGVEIDAVGMGRNGGKCLRTIVNVKRASQPMDLSTFAFATAHPSFLRRFLFGAWETEGAGSWARTFECYRGGGYCSPEQGAEMRTFVAEQGYDIDLTTPFAYQGGEVERTLDALRAWMARQGE